MPANERPTGKYTKGPNYAKTRWLQRPLRKAHQSTARELWFHLSACRDRTPFAPAVKAKVEQHLAKLRSLIAPEWERYTYGKRTDWVYLVAVRLHIRDAGRDDHPDAEALITIMRDHLAAHPPKPRPTTRMVYFNRPQPRPTQERDASLDDLHRRLDRIDSDDITNCTVRFKLEKEIYNLEHPTTEAAEEWPDDAINVRD